MHKWTVRFEDDLDKREHITILKKIVAAVRDSLLFDIKIEEEEKEAAEEVLEYLMNLNFIVENAGGGKSYFGVLNSSFIGESFVRGECTKEGVTLLVNFFLLRFAEVDNLFDFDSKE